MSVEVKNNSVGKVSGLVRLVAKDEQDVQIISSMLQDAIVPCISMAHEPEEKKFTFQAFRLRRENVPVDQPDEKKDKGLERIMSTVIFHGVHQASKNKDLAVHLKKKHGEDLICLAVQFSKSGMLEIFFSEGKTLRLVVAGLELYLADHEKSSWPTAFEPKHNQ